MNKRRIVLFCASGFVILAALSFFNYTALGYRMSVSVHGFVQSGNGVYIDQGFHMDTAEIDEILSASKERVQTYFGEMLSSPTIIITNDVTQLSRLGGIHDAMHCHLFISKTYIVISSQYLNVDVAAHELTHAELRYRIDKGHVFPTTVPVWFDEGLATQNDYRERYNEDAWKIATNNGTNITDFKQLTGKEFYKGDADKKAYNYIISRHKVKDWVDAHGIDGLIHLIVGINNRKDFNSLYYY